MYDSNRPPEADLMDTVAYLQLEVEALKCVQSGPSTSATKTLPVQSKPVAFTSTKVPKFSGWGGSRGGGGPGVQGPPLVPREGVLDPSSKMKKTAFIIFSFI